MTATVLWLSLCQLRDHYGRWPSELHITIDNTSGENKNKYVFAFAAWLVASGKVKQVRIFFLKVGHTHVIIDQIFGNIAVSLKGREILTCEELEQIINETCDAHPQWAAQKVRRLYSLFDVKQWTDDAMGHAVFRNANRACAGDEQGSYNGMYDFLFKTHPTYRVAVSYREDAQFPWRPYDSPGGCKVINNLPEAPPELAPLKSKSQWGYSDNKSIEQTIFMCSNHARTLTSNQEKNNLIDTWRKRLAKIPDDVDKLDPCQKLIFYHFDTLSNDALMLHYQSNNLRQEQEDEEDSAWSREYLCVRDAPFAVDPVISSEQSQSEYEKRKREYQATIRCRGPTSARTSPVFDGDLLLVTLTEPGIFLAKVEKLERTHTPTTIDLFLHCQLYAHAPDARYQGLFGTFEPVRDGRFMCKRTVRRESIVVYNVSLLERKKVLSLESLKELSRVLPEQYPMPENKDLPPHLLTNCDDSSEDEEVAQQSRRANQRARGRGAAVPRQNSTALVPQPSQPSRKGPARSARPADGAPGQDSESDDDLSAESSSDEEEEDENEEALVQPLLLHQPQGNESRNESSDENVRDFSLQQNSYLSQNLTDKLVYVNLAGNPEMEDYKVPATIALVEEDMGVNLRVRWYTPKWSKGSPPKHAKDVNYVKFWTEPNFLNIHKVPKSKRAPNLLPRDLIERYWHQDEISRESVLNVRLEDHPTTSTLWATDCVKVSHEFYKTVLSPHAKNVGCWHEL